MRRLGWTILMLCLAGCASARQLHDSLLPGASDPAEDRYPARYD